MITLSTSAAIFVNQWIINSRNKSILFSCGMYNLLPFLAFKIYCALLIAEFVTC